MAGRTPNQPPTWSISAAPVGGPYQLIDAEDGNLVGTMDAAHAMSQGHPGAIYIHQNAQYVVESSARASAYPTQPRLPGLTTRAPLRAPRCAFWRSVHGSVTVRKRCWRSSSRRACSQ